MIKHALPTVDAGLDLLSLLPNQEADPGVVEQAGTLALAVGLVYGPARGPTAPCSAGTWGQQFVSTLVSIELLSSPSSSFTTRGVATSMPSANSSDNLLS